MSSWQESGGKVLPWKGGFTSGKMDGAIEMKGLDDILNAFNNIMLSNPNMERTIHKIVKEVLKRAASNTRKSVRTVLDNDPRESYKAVKSTVYKRIFGGNVNIISSRRRGSLSASIPPQTTQIGRGGNRRQRSARTEQIMSYWGIDRAFVLRWLNDGTKARRISTSNNRSVNKYVGRGHTSASLESQRNGNRGAIGARHWFRGASETALESASREFAILLEQVINEMWEGGTASLSYNINEQM